MFLIDYFAYCMLDDFTASHLYSTNVSICLFAGGWILTGLRRLYMLQHY